MSGHSFSGDSSQDLRRLARFLEELDIAVREANRELLSQRLPHLDHQAFYRLSVGVAKLRASYLEAVLAVHWDNPQETAFADLSKRRMMYEEAKAGFEALRHTVENSYAPLHIGSGIR